jgi:hypothetical protein
MTVFGTSAPGGSVIASNWTPGIGSTSPNQLPNSWLLTSTPLGGNSSVSLPGTPVAAVARAFTHIDVFSAPRSIYYPSSIAPYSFPSEWWDLRLAPNWAAFTIATSPSYDPWSEPVPGSAISVAARDAATMDVLYLTSRNEIHDVGYADGLGWVDGAAATGNLSRNVSPSGTYPNQPGPPTVISRNPNQLDVFVADADGKIWTWWWSDVGPNAGAWEGPESITDVTSGPRVSSRTHVAAFAKNQGHIDIFAADDQGAVQSYWWDAIANNARWTYVVDPCLKRPGILPPGSTSPGAGIGVGGWATHLDVVTTSKSSPGALQVAWWDDFSPTCYGSYTVGNGFGLGEPIQVVTRYVNSLDVFGIQPDGSIRWIQWDGVGTWTGPSVVKP